MKSRKQGVSSKKHVKHPPKTKKRLAVKAARSELRN